MPTGIITCTSSNLYQVKIEQNIYQCNARGRFKKEKISPVPGDKVEITITDETKKEGILEEILPRNNYIHRPKMSNLTHLILVVSMNLPKPDFLLLDKQLVFSEMLGIEPIICLNKTDLEQENDIQKIAKRYEKIGYKVFQTNAKQEESIKGLKQYITNVEDHSNKTNDIQIIAFAGNSGVGKSTLINGLFKQQLAQEGEISSKNQRGKNTTTTVTLYPVLENSYIADTPGFSTFDIEEVESNDLARYFREFQPELANCEFASCTHQKETNCGIKQAIEQGKISKERYDNYCKIYEELKQKEERRW